MLLAQAFQGGFGLFARRDVLGGAIDTHHAGTMLIPHRLAVVAYPTHLAVLGHDAQFADVCLVGEQPALAFLCSFPVRRVDELFPATGRFYLLECKAGDARERLGDPFAHKGTVGGNAQCVGIVGGQL